MSACFVFCLHLNQVIEAGAFFFSSFLHYNWKTKLYFDVILPKLCTFCWYDISRLQLRKKNIE